MQKKACGGFFNQHRKYIVTLNMNEIESYSRAAFYNFGTNQNIYRTSIYYEVLARVSDMQHHCFRKIQFYTYNRAY